MGLVVYGTRIAGSELMSMFELTPRIEAVLKSVASSVLVALVVSECVTGGLRESAAVILAMLAMIAFNISLIAMAAGIVSAALFSHSNLQL